MNTTPNESPLWSRFRQEALCRPKKILFPEAEDARVLSAVSFLASQKLAEPILVGDVDVISHRAKELGLSLNNVAFFSPEKSPDTQRFAALLLEKRKAKGLTETEAQKLLQDPLFWASMALDDGQADAMIAGALRTTAETVRATFWCVGLDKHIGVAFGIFLMECPYAYGGPQTLLFADAAVAPQPSPRALARVAIEAAQVYDRLLTETPRVAMLSFSTYGSAEDSSVDNIRDAIKKIREQAPDLIVAGEIQGDAALVPDIRKQKKVPDADLPDNANVFIFPDLNAGNITYKLVQHLGGARAVGPILLGLKKPVSDLSRGCTDEDIVDAACTLSHWIDVQGGQV